MPAGLQGKMQLGNTRIDQIHGMAGFCRRRHDAVCIGKHRFWLFAALGARQTASIAERTQPGAFSQPIGRWDTGLRFRLRALRMSFSLHDGAST